MKNIKESLGGNLRQYGIMAALVIVVIIFEALTGGRLLAPDNVAALIGQNAYVLILAIGMVMVIIAGHIDLSVGSVVAVIGGVLGWAMYHWHWPWPAAVLLALVLGLAVGAWHGFWVAYVRIPAFIVTLAGMLVFRGLAIVIAGFTMAGFDSGFVAISSGSLPNFLGFAHNFDGVTLLIGVLGVAGLAFQQLRTRSTQIKHGLTVEPMAMTIIRLAVIAALVLFVTALLALSAGGFPIMLIIVGVLIFVYSFILNRTVFGRHVYAIGGNLDAAILSGINTARTNFVVFLHMGLLSAVAVVSRAGAATSTAGQSYELDAIAACFIGGTAVSGGVGRVSGAMTGALIMGVLNMGLSILGVPSAWQQVVKGLVLLAAVAFDLLSKRRARAA
ncbi:MAG: sugar ABC transporter permease [Bifidobacteriaceae bacterium]|jgi:putative multiple sugar transport system permease protein|nr:sugar ABC transporter permease [Bifidobacteriaceae bacterium]